jgi:osmoprotectant transport system substrate-binding protein
MPSRPLRLLRSAFVAAALCLLLASCVRSDAIGATPETALGDRTITIASFNFPESVTLAEVYAQALVRAGYPVQLQLNLGARELVDPALERGLVELVPEYAGTALSFVAGGTVEPSSDTRRTHADLRRVLAQRNVDVLAAAPGQDRNGVAVTQATADRYGLRTVSDLAPIASQLTFGGPPECPERPLCLPGLEQTYGLQFKEFTPLDSGGPLTHAALAGGEVDAALLFTSDGVLGSSNLVLLEDELHLQPAENVTPVVRQEVVARYGTRLVTTIDSVSETITTDALRRLNQRVSSGVTPHDAAAEFLGAWSPP